MDHAMAAVVTYLEQRAEIDQVLVKNKIPCSSEAFARWEEKNECQLPEDLKQFYRMSDGLDVRWSIKTSSNNSIPTYVGKMYINSLIDLTRLTAPGSKTTIVDELNDFANNDTPRFNSHAWRIFELDPCDGQGRVCLVYKSNMETSIWFLDRSLHFHRLTSSFTEYYRLLLIYCGLPYWHCKYTDFGIPPYVLHWYYMIVPALLVPRSLNDSSELPANLIAFDAEKVFQRKVSSSSKNSKVADQQEQSAQSQQSTVGIRSATQNRKRPAQQTKSTNRSSSVPRSINN